MKVWYDPKSRAVFGHGEFMDTYHDGEKTIVNSPQWDKKHQVIENFQGSIEGDGPYFLWIDGNLRSHPEGTEAPLSNEERISKIEEELSEIKANKKDF